MELRHLRYFVAVADCLHFGDAAVRLGIAQPSLSQQIARLEDDLQTRLLSRSKRRVELTDAGQLFLTEAREIVLRAERATAVVRTIGNGPRNSLKIGVGYCTDQSDIAAVIATFNARRSELHVETLTMSVASQLAAILDGRLDVGFVRPPVRKSGLRSEVVIREPFVAALPSQHPLCSRSAFPLSALANERFVLPPSEAVPALHKAVLCACRKAGFTPRAHYEADHIEMVLNLVAARAGVALVPAITVQGFKKDGVTYRRLRPMPKKLETALVWRKQNDSAILAEFISSAKHALPELTRGKSSEYVRATRTLPGRTTSQAGAHSSSRN
jgi:DNA-binding transcriptional LysR family regulator